MKKLQEQLGKSVSVLAMQGHWLSRAAGKGWACAGGPGLQDPGPKGVTDLGQKAWGQTSEGSSIRMRSTHGSLW